MARLGMSARPKIMEPAGFASAARAELALAIAARDAHASALAGLEAAGPRLEDDLSRARTTLEQAKAALASAQATAASAAVRAAIAGDPGPRGAVTAARTALTAAEDDFEVCRAACDGHPKRWSDLCEQQQEISKRVEKAAARVLGEHPAIAGLIAQTEKMQREVAVNMVALHWMRSAGVIEVVTFEYAGPGISDQDKQLNAVIGRLYQQGRHWIEDKAAIPETPPMLLAALERLKADANAALPEVVL